MSRSDIVNAKETGSSPPKKSEWFGYKYQVNPETSKLLQEAVFKDGGCWSYFSSNVAFLDKKHLYVDKYGHIRWSDDDEWFHNHELPEKQAPKAEVLETKKELSTPKHTSDHLLDALSSVVGVTVDKDRKITVQLQGTLAKVMTDLTKQTEEKQTMSNANRRVVNVKLLDNDSGLPVEYALVAQYQGIVTEDSDAVVINEILLNKNVANEIAKHNEKRVAQTDLEILKRTGNDVKLRQVKLKDLTWVVTTA